MSSSKWPAIQKLVDGEDDTMQNAFADIDKMLANLEIGITGYDGQDRSSTQVDSAATLDSTTSDHDPQTDATRSYTAINDVSDVVCEMANRHTVLHDTLTIIQGTTTELTRDEAKELLETLEQLKTLLLEVQQWAGRMSGTSAK